VEFKLGIAVPMTMAQSFSSNMPPRFAVGFKACCVAVALTLAAAQAAESQPAPALGATRQQVLARMGEPKSNIVVGNREVLFFERDRVVLRDNVVVEVERLPADLPRHTPPPAPAAQPAAGEETNSSSPAPEPAAEKEKSAAPAPAAAASESPAPARKPVTPPAPPPAPDPNAPLAIMAVRPAGSTTPRSEPAPPVAATTTAPAPAPTRPAAVPVAPATPVASAAPASQNGAVRPPNLPPALPDADARAKTAAPTSPVAVVGETAETAATKTDVAPAPSAPAEKQSKAAAKSRRRAAADAEAAGETPAESLFSAQTYVIAFVVIVGGAGYLVWRARQRQLALAATAVSRTPFAAEPVGAGGGGARFSLELLGRLEWKRFEELVASYYGKTGVVATRTKTGPASPVHIRISWKGEPRPFACVQCIAHPAGLIDVKPLQDLFAAISAEDIRRGYVITTGKFNVPARDFAEEKHLTLLPGEIFLEKLNALPDAARNELMQEVTTGDYSTPSCPKCEGKMVRSAEDSSVWQCPTHPDATLRT
jgi:hypothetical protein